MGTTHQGAPGGGWHALLYCAQPGLPLRCFFGSNIFYIFQNKSPKSFIPFRELLFLHKNNTMVVLLKTTSVRVSSIQIMQIRVQNMGKRVRKSRYIGDVSHPLFCLNPSVCHLELYFYSSHDMSFSWSMVCFSLLLF